MSRCYLVLPQLRVHDCNLESSHFTISFPLTAAAGFTIRLGREFNKLFGYQGKFLTILHHYECYPGKTKNPMAFCKGNGGVPAEADLLNPPIVEEVKGRVVVTLVLELSDVEQSTFNDSVKAEILERVFGLRFAGGDVQSIGSKHRGESISIACLRREQLPEYLLRCGSGWFLKDRSDILENASDKFAAFLKALTVSKSDGVKREPWVFATCLGYQLLEEPLPREGRRDEEVLHAYAEPLHGLVQLLHSRKILKQATENSSSLINEHDIFWKWKREAETKSSYLTARLD